MINVSCAIIQQDDKTLCLQRSSSMSLPLKWEFPGGKLNANETAEECLIREIFEELNVEIKIQKKLASNTHSYAKDKVVVLIPFVCKIVAGEIALSEHKAFKWLKAEELKSLDWAEADIPIMEEYLKLYND